MKSGARVRNRTEDLILTKDALYQLSYVGVKLFSAGHSSALSGLL